MVITNVTVDGTDLVIQGFNFGEPDKGLVTLNLEAFEDGDVTWTNNVITVPYPAVDDGSYLLTVQRARRRKGKGNAPLTLNRRDLATFEVTLTEEVLAAIAVNTADIATNATDIGDNDVAIGVNTAAIFALHPVDLVDDVTGTLSEADGGTGQAAGYTKGDILIATGPGTLVTLGVGDDNQVLTADDNEASGVKWADAAAGGGGGGSSLLHVNAFEHFPVIPPPGFSVPAGTISTGPPLNSALRISAHGRLTANANLKTITCFFHGTALASLSTTANGGAWRFTGDVTPTGPSNVRAMGHMMLFAADGSLLNQTMSSLFSIALGGTFADTAVLIQCTLGGGGLVVSQRSFLVELLQ